MDCPKCGGDMWDNREKKKNPKAPDYKCKDRDCDGVIWPPRGSKSTAAPSRQATGRTGTGNGHSDDRSNRIERQHSQEMALRYFDLKGITDVDTQKLLDMIDWFQRDVGRQPKSVVEQQAKTMFNATEPEYDEPPFWI